MSVIGMLRQQLGSYVKLAVPDEVIGPTILRRRDESHRQLPKPASESASCTHQGSVGMQNLYLVASLTSACTMAMIPPITFQRDAR